MAAVIDARSRELGEQRERALRALLARPLLKATDPAFVLVRAHAQELRAWFARECGWMLRVERDYARLLKRPANGNDASRGAPGFGRGRYVLLCLALAVLEREDVQITLQRLGERLIAEAADPDLAASGFSFMLERQSERRDLVQVCRLLLELGIISRVAGDEEAYINQSGDALYDIHRPILAALLAGDRGPSALAQAGNLAARLQALVADNRPEGEEARRTALRHGLARRLLDDPVVYTDELSADEREYFVNQRGPMCRRLAEASGLFAEHRAEGSALVDPAGDLSDVALPQQGTDAHATLLLAEYFAEKLRAGNSAPVPATEVDAFMRKAARDHRKYWRKTVQETGAERELATVALTRLAALRLIRRHGDTIHPLPAVCRFRLGEAELRGNRLQTDLLGGL